MEFDLDKAKDTIRQAEHKVLENQITKNVSSLILNELKPVLNQLSQGTKQAVQQYLEGIRSIKIETPNVSITTPDVIVPKIDTPIIPEIKIPKMEIPEIKLPKIEVDTEPIAKTIEKAFAKFKIPKPEIIVKEREIKDIGIKGLAGYFKTILEAFKGLFRVRLEGVDRNTPLPVILTDEEGAFYKAMMTAVAQGGGGGRFVEVLKPENAHIYNVTMTLINTEYSQELPQGTVAMTFQCRGGYDVRFSYTTGNVATPVAPYMTLKAGMIYYETNLKLTGKTLYLACATAGQVIEMVAYH